MLTQNNLRKGEGKLKSFDPKVGCAQQRRNMEDEEACWEQEWNYRKVFYNMAEKVDKLFSEYEKTIRHEKKDAHENRSVNHEGDGEDPPPSPSSSDSPHHSNQDSKHTSKKPFFKLDVKFDLLMYT